MKQKLYNALWNTDATAVGVGLSGVLFIWAFVLLNPFALTFASPFYTSMRDFLFLSYVSAETSELIWGVCFLVIGISTFIGALVDNRLSTYLLLPGIFILLFTALTLYKSSAIVPGPYLHFLFTIFMMWNYIRKRLTVQ